MAKPKDFGTIQKELEAAKTQYLLAQMDLKRLKKEHEDLLEWFVTNGFDVGGDIGEQITLLEDDVRVEAEALLEEING